jgi:Ca2+-binding RTX toxin-like protein
LGAASTDSLSIVNSRTATDDIGSTTSNITTTDFETVSINTGSYATAVAQNLGVLSTGSAAVTVTGGNNLVLAAGLVASSIDASGLTGSAILSMGAAATVGSITGGSNNDVLIGDTSSSINGGAGDDTVTGGSGNDTLVGGDGADTITNSGGSKDSVDGGAGIADVMVVDHDDVVAITNPMTAATGGTVTGVERLYLSGFTDDATARSITLANISSEINYVRINSDRKSVV